jgi:outer membrane protein OmpA-like peptidoglycan-associated protein
MKKTTKLFFATLFYLLLINCSYAQNAYVLLDLESYQCPKIKLDLYSQDSVLIDSFELIRDSTFVLKIPIKKSYYLKIVSLDSLTDYKEMDKIIPLDFTRAEPYAVRKQIIDLQRYECCYDSFNSINFPTNRIDALLGNHNIETLEMLANYLKSYPYTKIKLVGHTDHVEKNKQSLSFKRAEAVKNYLLSHKIPNSRIEIDGKGDTAPTVPNIVDGKKDKNNMALNRRVDFSVSHLFGSTKKAIVLIFADSITAQETQITADLHYPSGESMKIVEKFVYNSENIKILYLFDAFDYTLHLKRNGNTTQLQISLSKKIEDTVVVEL